VETVPPEAVNWQCRGTGMRRSDLFIRFGKATLGTVLSLACELSDGRFLAV